jgi:hypothetical protein
MSMRACSQLAKLNLSADLSRPKVVTPGLLLPVPADRPYGFG